METTKKNLDAVRMVRRIRDAHHEELKEASRQERIEFFNSKVRDGGTRPDRAGSPAPSSESNART